MLVEITLYLILVSLDFSIVISIGISYSTIIAWNRLSCFYIIFVKLVLSVKNYQIVLDLKTWSPQDNRPTKN